MKSMKIAIASDHGGFKLKQALAGFLEKQGYKIKDFGTHSLDSCDYPKFTYKAAKSVAEHKSDRGIVICTSGIGNSIVANKVVGVRAALCYNLKAAKLSRQHNNANVLVLGELFVSIVQAKKIVTAWLNTEFEGGRHLRRVKQIGRIDKLKN